MEFKFNVNDIFKHPIVEVNNNLIPPGFSGDRRALWDTLGKVSEVINAMGEASAAAQGLPKPITTAERLRNSEHKLYFLIDQASNNGKGAVTGMLKTGKKGLYVFDRDGQHYQVTPPCVLDFYIHESRQRTGLGKQLFEHMLQKEEIEPVKMAIDRPSEKLLGFLNKHYTLNSPVKQMNNYVLFDGFFPKSTLQSNIKESKNSGTLEKKESANGLQKFSSPQGRYGAPRPPCSMGQIIHNQMTNTKNQEPTGVQSMPATNYSGSLHGGPYPNYVSQSAPNINIGQRILNNAYNQNLGYSNFSNASQIHNNNAQTNYNSQNVHHNVGAATKEVCYSQYNNLPQPSMQAVTNPNEIQNQPQYSTPQNMFNDNSTIGDQINIQGQKNLTTDPKYHENKGNMQQPTLQVDSAHSNLGSSQYNINNPYYGNRQEYQQQMNPHQNYTNINKQFENINLSNEAPLSNIGMNNMISAQYPSQILTANVQPTPPETYQDQRIAKTGDLNELQNVNVGYSVNNTNTAWNQANLTNTPQNQTYNVISNNAFTQNSKSFENNKMSDLIAQYPPTPNNIQMVNPQEVQIQNVAKSQEIIPVSQQHIIDPHVYSNQNNQQQMPTAYPNDIRKLASTTMLQNPQVNKDQLHSQQLHNVSQHQVMTPQPYGNYNMLQEPHISTQNFYPVTSHPFNVGAADQQMQQNVALQQPPYNKANIPVTYNQTYSTQNLNTTNERINHHVDKPNSYMSVVQETANPVYSARNLSNSSNPQICRHNVVSESASAPNMSNIIQGNYTHMPKVFAENTQADNNSTPIMQDQEISRQSLSDAQEDGEKSHLSSKLERPQSLSIQKSEENIGEIASNDKDCKNFESNNMESTNIQINSNAVKIKDDEIANIPSSVVDDIPPTKAPNHLTNQGYFDIKFYHNKLW